MKDKSDRSALPKRLLAALEAMRAIPSALTALVASWALRTNCSKEVDAGTLLQRIQGLASTPGFSWSSLTICQKRRRGTSELSYPGLAAVWPDEIVLEEHAAASPGAAAEPMDVDEAVASAELRAGVAPALAHPKQRKHAAVAPTATRRQQPAVRPSPRALVKSSLARALKVRLGAVTKERYNVSRRLTTAEAAVKKHKLVVCRLEAQLKAALAAGAVLREQLEGRLGVYIAAEAALTSWGIGAEDMLYNLANAVKAPC